MARSVIYSCDVCGKQKGSNNHWWDVWIEDGEYNSAGPPTKVFSVGPFDMSAEDEHKVSCGEGCTIKLMSRFMTIGSLDAPVEVAQAPVMEGGS